MNHASKRHIADDWNPVFYLAFQIMSLNMRVGVISGKTNEKHRQSNKTCDRYIFLQKRVKEDDKVG